jgi:eukaryotic-like serine/threonine-protein kinase
MTGEHDAKGRAHAATAPGDVTSAIETTEPSPSSAEGTPPYTQVGRYLILDRIGSGGMGDVYAARDPELDRRVAIKLLRSPRSGARLLREARALARLAHPNVVAVHDVGIFEERSFVAMELVEGTTLRAWMEERPRPWREVLDVFVPAGRGLSAAHAAGLVHRDFKPENVMIGSDGRVRVLDFGIVGSVPADGPEPEFDMESADPTRLTAPGGPVGTPGYMAPEQLCGQEIDARADQFGFCVALWEALYGARPFGGATLRALTAAVLRGVVDEPPPGRPAPAWLRRLVTRGLSVERGARHRSMDALLADIAAGLAVEDASGRLIGRRYEPLRQAASAPVTGSLRAVDRLTGKVVTLERVGLRRDPDEPDSTNARLELARVFRDLTLLRHPNLLGVLDFGFDRERLPYFVLDQRDAAEDAIALVRPLPPSLRLDVIVQILRGLAYLHRRRMALGTVAPGDLSFSSGQVKLVPLGITIDPSRARPAYSAPELSHGAPPSPTADLYALGVLAFEIFAGHHPFAGAPRGAEPPDASALELDPPVAAVILRLLEPDPGARPQTAEDVIAALAAATGRPLAADTVETRESFLQATPLVGRDVEVTKLHAALRGAVAGRGSAWLVGGESGVGKSRLLEELRAFALVQGALVLRGQEESEGGSPYRLFRDALRRLALFSDLDEIEAGVLLPIVPDLEEILARPVAPVQELDAPAMHARLRDVVERILRRQDQPMVLLLEDLQWSRSDSLKLLQGLCPLASKAPLLIVATFRDDERPALRDDLPAMRPIALARLRAPAIAELAAAMIGEAGRKPELVALLARETEGNAFFLVEVVRALAEEAGGLDKIGTAALPEKVFAGGIRRVVQRRLQRLPGEARALLRTAAVIGRTIHPELFAALSPEVDLDAWLSRCVEAAVLERVGDALRFAHDKLREGLLAEIAGAEGQRLHGVVAEAIERVYPDVPAQYAALAHHFRESGEAAKEAHYATLAGEQALRDAAFLEARAHLDRALALKREGRAPPLEIARIDYALALVAYSTMDLERAVSSATAACSALGRGVPRRGARLVVALIWQIAIQVSHLILRRRLVKRDGERREAFGSGVWGQSPHREAFALAATAASLLSKIHMYNSDGPGVLSWSLHSVNLADVAGTASYESTALLGLMAGFARLDGLAARYFARTHVDEPQARDFLELATSAFLETPYLLGLGRVQEAERRASWGLQTVRRFNRTHIISGYLASMLAYCAFYGGAPDRALEELHRVRDEIDAAAARHGAVFANAEAAILGLRGEVDQAEAVLRPFEGSFSPLDRLPQTCWFGLRALVHAQRGQHAEACAAAREAMRLLPTPRAIATEGAGLLAGLTEAFLGAWEAALARGEDGRAEARDAARALSLGRVWTRTFPLGRSQWLLYAGRAAWLRGAKDQARQVWERSLAAAEAASLPFFQALAHDELGRTSAPGSPERAGHLAKARALFAAAGARVHVARIRRLVP